MMKLLLDNGADINMQFGGRDTALMAAVWNNDGEARGLSCLGDS
jgi:hypothetical protein